MSEAAAAAPVTPTTPPGEAPPPQQGRETTAAKEAKKIKADLGDGEQEYELDAIIGNAKRGRNAAQLTSAAEKKAREAEQRLAEAQKKQAEIDAFWEGLKDPAKARKYLRDKGVPVREMSIAEIDEAIAEEKKAQELSPEAKRVKELEEKLAQQEAEKKKGEEAEKQKAWKADYERHLEDLSKTFTDVLEKAGLPKGSARRAFPYVAQLYALAEQEGKPVDVELAAAHVRERFTEEHEWLYRDQKTKALNIEALQSRFSPDDWKAIQRHAVQQYMSERAKQRGGGTPPAPAQTEASTTLAPKPKAERPIGNQFFRALDKTVR